MKIKGNINTICHYRKFIFCFLSAISFSSHAFHSELAPVSGAREIGLAHVLDNMNGIATGQLGEVITTLATMTPDNQRLALKHLSPERSQVTEQSSVNTVSSALDTVQVRLDTLRSGVGFQSSFTSGLDLAHSDDSNATSEGLSSGNDALNRSFWAKGFAGKADRDSRNGFAGADSDIYGIMFGIDKVFDNNWLLGASFAYAKTSNDLSDYRSGDNTDIDTYQLTGYFGRTFERWYFEGMLSYARQDYSTKRDTHLTGIAHGDFDGDLIAARFTAGVPFKFGQSFTLTPYVGVDAYHIKQSSYTEKDAGVLSLNISGNNTDRVRSILGTEFAILKKLSDGSVLRPSLKLQWRHEFNNDGVNSTSSLVGGGAQFESVGEQTNGNIYGIQTRLNWEKTNRLSLGVEVGYEKAAGYQSLMGQLNGTWRF